MLQDELSTAFRWYNDIDKQNRYKSPCAAVCDFKLLTPLNSVLPFQINTQDTPITVTSWTVYCADDDSEIAVLDTAYLSIVTAGGQDYISYDGDAMPINISCGRYYMAIVTSSQTWYSELFQVEDIEDTAFSQIDFPLFSLWRWYNDQEKQTRYLRNCLASCDFSLITGNDALLPFMFRKPSVSNVVNSWILRNIDGSCEVNLDVTLIQIAVFGDYDYIFYEGEVLSTSALTLPNSDFSGLGSWFLSNRNTIADLWDIVSNRAKFTSPNSGFGVFTNQLVPFLAIVAGTTYTITYTIVSFSGPPGSYFKLIIGATSGTQRTTAGTFTETIIATTDGFVQLYAQGNYPNGTVTDTIIEIDNISISEEGSLPCGTFESIIDINGTEYYSELIKIEDTLRTNELSNYLLQEDESMILQENGSGILLE